MNITFVYGFWACGPRHFDFTRLYEDPRGLTGSEISFFSYARELAKRGHFVKLFAPIAACFQSYDWCGIKLHSINDWNSESSRGSDCVLSWNEPDQLRPVDKKILRVLNQQLNDFTYAKPGYDDAVDIYTSPSDAHRSHMVEYYGKGEKWRILPNGCNPSIYPKKDKIKGRVLYASSPDRGLHLLLQQWPEIKRRVPEAELKVFYNFDAWLNNLLPCDGDGHHPHVRECSYRAFYIKEALQRLKNLGVKHEKSISRAQMVEEMAEASTLAYPCDTVTYTEGFSVTLMEACASEMVPITSSVDSLGAIYGGIIPMVQAPVRNKLDEFTDLVVKSLKDENFRNEVISRTVPFAQKHDWKILTNTLENIIRNGVEMKRSQ